MRLLVKRGVESLLLHGGPAAASRRAHRGRTLVLAYHNIVPAGEAVRGDASLHLDQRDFAVQLDLLLDSGVRIVRLDELVDTDGADTGRERQIAITFDDAYCGAVEAGVSELTRRGLPATFFVVPGLVGGRTFWWDALAASGGLTDQVRLGALKNAGGRTDEVIAWAGQRRIPVGTVPEHARSASESQLAAAVSHPGIELASHTWSHPNLARLGKSECEQEFQRADDWLRDRLSIEPCWMSYPYGIYGEAAVAAAVTSGYRGAFRINGGWLPRCRREERMFRLPRLNVPAGVSSDGFSLRLAGLLGG